MRTRWTGSRCPHHDLLWCCVTEPMARDRSLDYDDQVRYLTARVRADYGAHVGDPEWDENSRRLVDTSPELADLWTKHEVAEPAEVTVDA